MCKSDSSMYKGAKEIFNGRFLPHKYNRNLNISCTLALTPNINLRFERPPLSAQSVKWTMGQKVKMSVFLI